MQRVYLGNVPQNALYQTRKYGSTTLNKMAARVEDKKYL